MGGGQKRRSAAQEFARRKPRKLVVRDLGGPYTTTFEADEDGRLRWDNAGPFAAREALRLRDWLTEVFDHRPAPR